MDRTQAETILAAHAEEIRAFGVRRVALFGSVARNEAGPDSDVDILVDWDQARPPMAPLELEGFLTDLMGRRVEVVDRARLKPFLKDRILAEAEGRFVTSTPPKSPRQPLADMVEQLDWIRSVLPGRTIEDYRNDWMFRQAIEGSVEIISEASRCLPDDLTARHPDIPWRKIADIGNVLRHMYDRVEIPIMWDVLTVHLAPLRAAVVAMIAAVEDDRPPVRPTADVGDP